MKLLLTGASGFVGSKVLRLLIEKYGTENIICLSNRMIEGVKTIPARNYQFDADYLASNGCEEIETCIHLGAATPKTSRDGDNLVFSSNIMNTQKILESKLPNLKKIVFTSTLDVYEHGHEIITEETPAVPATLYGWSKLYCEQMLSKYCSKTGIQFMILRLGFVYGEGEEVYRKVMPVMIQNAVEGKDLMIFGDGEAVRSYVYVGDVAKSVVRAVETGTGMTINVVSDEPVTVNQLAEMIRNLADSQISIVHCETSQPNLKYTFDNSKLREILLPELTPFGTGLEKEFHYMKAKLYEN